MNKNLLKYIPYFSMAMFVVALISVFLTWIGIDLAEEFSYSLWNSEANIRYFILGLALAGVVLSFLTLSNKKAVLGVVVVAVLTFILALLKYFSERSDATEIGIEISIGIGLILTLLSMTLTVVANLLDKFVKIK